MPARHLSDVRLLNLEPAGSVGRTAQRARRSAQAFALSQQRHRSQQRVPCVSIPATPNDASAKR